MNTVCKKEDEKKLKGVKIYAITLSAFTIALTATAISKMALYIKNYGLSPLRVYTSWFMTLILLIFGIVCIRGFILKKGVYKQVFAVFAVMLGLLCFFDADGLIAGYNIRGYKNGTLKELDVSLFYDLSDSAVKHAAALRNDPVYGAEINEYLRMKSETIKIDAYGWNLESVRAFDIIEETD